MSEETTGKVEIAVADLTRTRAHERIKMQQQDADTETTKFLSFFKQKVLFSFVQV